MHVVKQLLFLSLAPACFLPAGPGCLAVARLHVLVSAGMFGPAVQIDQSVPSLSPSRYSPSKQNQEEEECTDTDLYCNHSRLGTVQQQVKTEKQFM